MRYPHLTKQFWESVKNNIMWSEDIFETDWDKLYPDAKKQIAKIFREVRKIIMEDL